MIKNIGIVCPGGRLSTWYPFIKSVVDVSGSFVTLFSDTQCVDHKLNLIKERNNSFSFSTYSSPFDKYIPYDAFRNLNMSQLDMLKNFDLVHVIADPSYLMSYQVLNALRGYPVKVTMRAAQNIYRKFPYPFQYFEKYSFLNADAIYPLDERALNVIMRKGYSCDECRFLPNGFDGSVFKQLLPIKEVDEPFSIGYVGSLALHKGIKMLLDYAHCAKGINLTLVGSHFGYDISLNDISYLIDDVNRNTGNRVKWVGRVDYEDLVTFYNDFDCLVLPSIDMKYSPTYLSKYLNFLKMPWSEQFGRVIVESMSCGTPVIGSDSGAIPDVIGRKDLVFKQGSIDQMDQLINRFRSDSSFYADIVKYSLERSRLFSWDNVACKALSYWCEL